MSAIFATRDPCLAGATRFPDRLTMAGDKASLQELAFLVGLGLLAASVRCAANLRLGIPGHSILVIVLPMAFGTAVTRRRGAGVVMGASALAGASILGAMGVGRTLGPGAVTSLALTGPAFDLWLAALRKGDRSVYWAWIAAGATSNLVAFAVRGVAKVSGIWPGVFSAHYWSLWASRAAITYPLCGLLAGLLAAGAFFKCSDGGSPGES